MFQEIAPLLKRQIRSKGITYPELSKSMNMSVSGLKKLLVAKDCSLARLEQLCTALDLTVNDVLQSVRSRPINEFRFSLKQEEYLSKNRRDLSVYWKLVYEGLDRDTIVSHLKLSNKECFQILRRLDTHGLIKLLPNDQVKVPDLGMVKWASNGPLVKLVKEQWAKALIDDAVLKALQDESKSHYSLRFYELTDSSRAELLAAIRQLDLEFANRSVREKSLFRRHTSLIRMVTAVAPGSFVS